MTKSAIRSFMRFLLSPVRRNYRRRNGVASQEERVEVPNEVLLTLARDMIDKGHSVTIHVKGWSMRPFLEHQRDKVLLVKPAGLNIGDAVLAEISPGHFVLHRIIELDGEQVTLMGDGNVRGTEHCTRADVAGVVREYIRPKRTILASDPRLIRRIRLWRKLLPVRRYLLFVYKTIVEI